MGGHSTAVSPDRKQEQMGKARKASVGMGGQGLQIPPGTLGVQSAQGQIRFPRAGYSGGSNDLIQWYVHVNIF